MMADRTIPVLRVSGTYFQVGESIGRTLKQGIVKYLTTYPYLNDRLKPFSNTTEGSAIYQKYLDHVKKLYPQCIYELEGVAKGADVDFRDIFLINIEPEMAGILGDTAAVALTDSNKGSHLPDTKETGSCSSANANMATTSGCTDIFLNNPREDTIIHGHTEDYPPEFDEACMWLEAKISDTINSVDVKENFSFCTIAGILPGGNFGVISPSLLLSANNIYQIFIDKEGTRLSGCPSDSIMRLGGVLQWGWETIDPNNATDGQLPGIFVVNRGRVLNRICLQATSRDDYINRVKADKGIASGYNLNILSKSANKDSTFCCTSLELAASEHGTIIHAQTDDGFCFHVNMFKHLEIPHVPEESSLQRTRIINYLTNQRSPVTKQHVLEILSDEENKDFPVYRNGNYPDTLQTLVIGVLDMKNMQIEVYTNKPAISDPVLVIDIMKTFQDC